MSRLLILSLALLLGTAGVASAERLSAREMINLLVGQERVFSGGSVSSFRPDGTYRFRHEGSDERGTYVVTTRDRFVLEPRGGRQYALELDSEDFGDGWPYTLIYATGPHRGSTYGMR